MRTILLCAISLAAPCLVSANNSSLGSAQKIRAALRSSEYIESFFVNRTGTYYYSEKMIKEKSSIRVYRYCGNNCANLAESILLNMRDAVPTKCLRGQENVLINIGGKTSISYSQRGR
ncbi:MAG: hypothetical protein WBP11_14895, partial [Dokdonella sp.]